MLRKFLSIFIIFIAFGFLVSHELIPHHHHDWQIQPHHEHEHDEEEHSHNILKCFFSLLHHPDFNNVVLISTTFDNELVKSNLFSLGLPFSCYSKAHLEPALKNTCQNFLFAFDKNFNSSLTFRGPPMHS